MPCTKFQVFITVDTLICLMLCVATTSTEMQKQEKKTEVGWVKYYKKKILWQLLTFENVKKGKKNKKKKTWANHQTKGNF